MMTLLQNTEMRSVEKLLNDPTEELNDELLLLLEGWNREDFVVSSWSPSVRPVRLSWSWHCLGVSGSWHS